MRLGVQRNKRKTRIWHRHDQTDKSTPAVPMKLQLQIEKLQTRRKKQQQGSQPERIDKAKPAKPPRPWELLRQLPQRPQRPQRPQTLRKTLKLPKSPAMPQIAVPVQSNQKGPRRLPMQQLRARRARRPEPTALQLMGTRWGAWVFFLFLYWGKGDGST